LNALKQEYGISGGTSAPTLSTRTFSPSKGSGCPMLDGIEAARILDVAIDRAEINANGPDDSEQCQYWVTAAERQRLAKAQIDSGLGSILKGDGKNIEKMGGGMLGAAIEASGDNKEGDPAFTLQVWRRNGREMWDKLESAKSEAKNVVGGDLVGMATEQVSG